MAYWKKRCTSYVHSMAHPCTRWLNSQMSSCRTLAFWDSAQRLCPYLSLIISIIKPPRQSVKYLQMLDNTPSSRIPVCMFVWSWTWTFNHYMAQPLWGCSSFNTEHMAWYSKLSVVLQGSLLFLAACVKMEMVSQHILSKLLLHNRIWEGTLLSRTSTFTTYGPSLATHTSMVPWWWWKSKMERTLASECWSRSKPSEQSHLLTLGLICG